MSENCLLIERVRRDLHPRRWRMLAVTVGFEPTVRLHAHNFSRVAPSAARTRYRQLDYLLLNDFRNCVIAIAKSIAANKATEIRSGKFWLK